MAIYPTSYLGENDLQRSIGGLILTKCSYKPAFNRNWHYHENPSLSLNLKGGTIDERKTGVRQIREGDVILHRSEEFHRNKFFTTNSRQFCIEIEPGWFSKYDMRNHFEANSFVIENSDIQIKMIRQLLVFP